MVFRFGSDLGNTVLAENTDDPAGVRLDTIATWRQGALSHPILNQDMEEVPDGISLWICTFPK
jgi:hypothetical protein